MRREHRPGEQRTERPKEPIRGAGDVVHRVASDWLGVPECGGCAKRREALNQWLPFGRRKER